MTFAQPCPQPCCQRVRLATTPSDPALAHPLASAKRPHYQPTQPDLNHTTPRPLRQGQQGGWAGTTPLPSPLLSFPPFQLVGHPTNKPHPDQQRNELDWCRNHDIPFLIPNNKEGRDRPAPLPQSLTNSASPVVPPQTGTPRIRWGLALCVVGFDDRPTSSAVYTLCSLHRPNVWRQRGHSHRESGNFWTAVP